MCALQLRHMSCRQFVCVESGAVRAPVTGGAWGSVSTGLIWFCSGFDFDLILFGLGFYFVLAVAPKATWYCSQTISLKDKQ
jgi:hypothetical protein